MVLIILLIIHLYLEEKMSRSHCGIKVMYHHLTDSSFAFYVCGLTLQNSEEQTLLLKEVPCRFVEGTRASRTVGLPAFCSFLTAQYWPEVRIGLD